MAGFQNFVQQMQNIDVKDLPYVERDLNFAQKVSLCFLLFGDQYTNGAYILQKLLALARQQDVESGQHHSNLLTQYAKTNPQYWRSHLIESLCIIRARRVLRKLGFRWEELRAHYLPNVSEITLHVHPLLKALFVICEQLTESQSGRMVLDITDMIAQRRGQASMGDPLSFYNFKYLEIFFLDWFGRRYLELGDRNTKGSNVEILIEYLKLKDMHAQAKLLIDTVNTNDTTSSDATGLPPPVVKCEPYTITVDVKQSVSLSPLTSAPTPALQLTNKPPGIVLIINQQEFHQNVEDELKYLLPLKKLNRRTGTDADKKILEKVFSSLGYKVEPHDNVDHMDMIEYIREACQRSLLPDSLIVCILSHGFDGAVYASNSIPLRITDIENVICANDNLRDKPKILIIQACQLEDKTNNGKMFDMKTTTYSPVQHINMLLAMSTVRGFSAQRHTIEGSWFIQCLCEAIEQYAARLHIGDILTIVTNKVSQKCGDKGQTMVPKTSGSLRQNVFFPKSVVTPTE